MGNNIISENRISKYLSYPFIPYLIMIVLVIIIFSGFLFSNKMLVSSDQLNGLDAKVFYKNSILKYHQFPFWFNCRLGGMPTIDAMFGDAFYPPSIIINLLFPVHKAIGIKMILHILLAGIFFYLLLSKGFGMSPLISLTGAIFYMFNPQFVSHIYPGHDGKMYVIAWVPFIVLWLKKLYEKPSLIKASLMGLGIGMCILTSHIQLTYFVLWGLFLVWFSFPFLYLWNNYIVKILLPLFTNINIHSYKYTGEFTLKKTLNFTLFFWIGIFIGISIGAIQLFPSFFYVREAFSVRGVDRGFEFATSWSLHWPELISLWVPEFVNTLDYYWGENQFKLNSEYAGMIPLLFSIIAIILKPKSKFRIFWGIIALLAVLYALGSHTPVFYLAYELVPGVKKFRAPSMIMFWFSFSTILLTSLAIYDINKGELKGISELKQKNWAKYIIITIFILTTITIIFSIKDIVENIFMPTVHPQKINIFKINYSKNFLPFLWLWLLLASSSLFLFRMVILNKLSPKTFTIAILCIGLIDILRVDAIFIQLINPKGYFYRDPTLEPLVKEIQKTPFRCYSLPGSFPIQNAEGIFSLEGVSGFHDNELRWYREFRGDQQDKNFIYSFIGIDSKGNLFLKGDKLSEGNPFLNIANVKYLLVRDGYNLLTIPNKNALERISFAKNYQIIDSNRVAELLSNGEIDYHNYVCLYETPQLPEAFNLSDDSITYSPNCLNTVWQKYTPNYRKAIVDVPADGFLRISEVFYPAWEIKIDGKKEKYYRADITWIALPIKSGKHTIEIIAHSKYFSKFAPISFVISGILLLYWLYYLLKNRNIKN